MTVKRLTKREIKSQQVRDNILDVSRQLFIQQGYTATTIREILSEAGITTGTLYHFFQDKEDILMQLAADHLDDVSTLIQSLLPDNPDPAVFYTLELSLLFTVITKHEMVADLYLNMYRSWRVADMICHNHGKRNRQLFEKFKKGMNDEWWYMRSLAITGIIQNCIAEQVNNKKISVEEYLQVVLSAAFGYFNIPAGKIKPAISRALTIIRNKRVGLYEVYL